VIVTSTVLLAAFGGGEWIFILLHALLFGVLYFFGLRTRSDLTVITLFLVGFVVAAIYFGFLLLALPADSLAPLGLPIYFIAAWEAGLLSATAWRFFRQLLGVAQEAE
jgi:hypothetical protein